jgi:outer membrane protein TolC
MRKVLKQQILGVMAALFVVGCTHYQAMPLTASAVDHALAVPAEPELRTRVEGMRHPLLPPVSLDLQHGLTPDSAAVMAVIVNPGLRAQRDRRSLAEAQLLQAGLLPNPTLDFSYDPVTGGNTQGAVNAYGVGLNWEITALITHDAKVAATRARSESVQLDVAWQEWQFAQAARKAVFDLIALRGQLEEEERVDRQLAQQVELVRQAVDAHQKTVLDLAAVEAAAQKAHSDFLAIRRDLRRQQLVLNQALGLGPQASVPVAMNFVLPARLLLPPEEELQAGIDQRRLDLLGLRQGYQSQEQSLRAAVLAQFPKIVLGLRQASDNTGVQSTGFGITVDLPIFDRNQGVIATEKATRQQLFDEYAGRVFEARSTVAQLFSDINALAEQIAAAETAVPKLERLVRTYQLALGQRNVDVLSYYTAQNELSQQRIDLLKLKQQLMDNQIALEIASGRYFPQPMAPAPASRPATSETHE